MEIIYQDEMFTVTKPSMNYFESKINSYPKILKEVNAFGGEIYHTTLEEFYAYRDKFNAVFNSLKPETEEAFHITCLYHKQIESSTCPIDVRYKYSGEEMATMFFLGYKTQKDDAIKQIDSFVANNDELNYKQEEERNKLIYKYNLLEEYKDKMQSNLLKAQKAFEGSLDEVLDWFKKHNNDNRPI